MSYKLWKIPGRSWRMKKKRLKEIEETQKITPSGHKPPLTLTLTTAVDRKNFVNNLQPQKSQEIKVGQISNRY